MARNMSEDLRRRIDLVTGLPTLIAFTTLAGVSLGLPEIGSLKDVPRFLTKFSSINDAVTFLYPKIPILALIIATIIWYFRYRFTVYHELELMNDAFAEGRAPLGFGSLEGRWMIMGVGCILVFTFLILILLAPHLRLYCVGALVLHAVDLIGNGLILQNLSKFFLMFPISDKDADLIFVRRRREVIKNYYFRNPTLLRIIGTLLITATILVFVPEDFESDSFISYLLYGVMTANIIVSEVIMSIWRAKRDRALYGIDDDENLAHARATA
jgi:hypothetical protein